MIDQEVRRERLSDLLRSLEHGQAASDYIIRRALRSAQWKAYEQARDAVIPPLTAREREVLSHYRELLRRGDAAAARARRLLPFGRGAFRREVLLREMVDCFEQALLVIREHGRLWLLLDRPFDEWDLEPESMPRPCGSKSEHARATYCPHCAARRQTQIHAVRDALEAVPAMPLKR